MSPNAPASQIYVSRPNTRGLSDLGLRGTAAARVVLAVGALAAACLGVGFLTSGALAFLAVGWAGVDLLLEAFFGLFFRRLLIRLV